MTTYGHHLTARPLLHVTRRIWAVFAVLVIAGIVTLVVALNSSDTKHSQGPAPRLSTVQNDGHAAPIECRPTNVVRPC